MPISWPSATTRRCSSGMQQRGHRRHVEARLDAVFFEHLENARHARPDCRTGPRRAGRSSCRRRADRWSRDRCRTTTPPRSAPRPAIPPAAGCARRGPARPAGATPPRAIARVRGRFAIGFAGVHAVLLRPCFVRRRGDGNGRSGEIRTLDPQHPMLMRYQAALRSDRGGSRRSADHSRCGAGAQPAHSNRAASWRRQLVEQRPDFQQLAL